MRFSRPTFKTEPTENSAGKHEWHHRTRPQVIPTVATCHMERLPTAAGENDRVHTSSWTLAQRPPALHGRGNRRTRTRFLQPTPACVRSGLAASDALPHLQIDFNQLVKGGRGQGWHGESPGSHHKWYVSHPVLSKSMWSKGERKKTKRLDKRGSLATSTHFLLLQMH